MFIKLTENQILCPAGGFMVEIENRGTDLAILQLTPLSISVGGTEYLWYAEKAEAVWRKFEKLAITVPSDTAK